MKEYIIDNSWLSLNQLEDILSSGCRVRISEKAKARINNCRQYLDDVISKNDKLIYGVNTGFGSLCDTIISENDLETLQRNLVLSHACGMGLEVPSHIVKRMLLLKVLGLAQGNSGVQLITVERLLFFYNRNICPVIYEMGSLGASGDLAPLAHLALPLIGEGEVEFEGDRYNGNEILDKFELEPIVLKSKEGLALLNGTQFMSAYGTYCTANSLKLWKQFNLIGALSLEAYDCRSIPYQENVNAIRNQVGQIEVAGILRKLLDGSEMSDQEKQNLQDPYSFRCIPQVHGATKDAIDYTASIFEREVNAVTDNPTIFPEEADIVSAGNFHGQPLALTMDFLAIAMAEMASISERRVYKLISGTRDLPPFLVSEAGLNSGFMITQYSAASIVSQNKQLCTPASVDTIDSSNGQEDHVSMGANAATKLFKLIDNCYSVQAIELMNAAQAMDFRPKKSSRELEKLRAEYRKLVPFISKDEYMHPFLAKSKVFVQSELLIK